MRTPKYRKNGDGRAFAVYPKSNGKREYFGKYGTKEAEDRYKEWLTRLLNSENLLTQEKLQSEYYTIELVLKYLDYLKGRVSPVRYSFIDKSIERLVNLHGREPAINIGPRVLLLYQEMMSKETYQNGSVTNRYKRVTINKAVKCIKRFVKWCCKFEFLPPEHYLKLEAVSNLEKGEYGVPDGSPVPPVTLKTIKNTLPYLNNVIGTMVMVQYYCGLRPGEVCNLNWGEISKEGEVWFYAPKDHKTAHIDKSLVKAIPPSAQRLILSSEIFTRNNYLFDPRIHAKKKTDRENYLTGSYSVTVRKGSARAVKNDAIEKAWSPNQLRHAIATDIRRVLSRDKAQSYLGHTSIDTTGIYADRTREEIAEIAMILEKSLFNT